jgi:hypothetical protein
MTEKNFLTFKNAILCKDYIVARQILDKFKNNDVFVINVVDFLMVADEIVSFADESFIKKICDLPLMNIDNNHFTIHVANLLTKFCKVKETFVPFMKILSKIKDLDKENELLLNYISKMISLYEKNYKFGIKEANELLKCRQLFRCKQLVKVIRKVILHSFEYDLKKEYLKKVEKYNDS